jgi:hypothetical protein
MTSRHVDTIAAGFVIAAAAGAFPLYYAIQAFGSPAGTIAAEKFGSGSENALALALLSFFFVLNPLLAAIAIRQRKGRLLRGFVYLSFLHFPIGSLCAYAAFLVFKKSDA